VEVPDGKPHDAETVSPAPGAETMSPEGAARQCGLEDTTAIPTNRNEAEAVQPTSVTNETARSRPLYFKRHRATSLLFIVFLITLVSAFFIYPRRASVYRPQPFSVSVQEDGDVGGMMIDVYKKGSQFTLSVIPTYRSTNSVSYSDFLVALPSNAIPTNCRKPNCFVTKMFVNNIGTSNLVYAPNQINLFLSLTLTNSTFGWNTNGLNLEGQLPEAQVYRGQGGPVFGGSSFEGQPLSNASVSIQYQISSANTYDSTGGPEPAISELGDLWNVPASSLTSPIPISASDNSTANLDSLRVFVAGALLGIAGGALVGAIQESTHKEIQPSIVPSSSLRVDLRYRQRPPVTALIDIKRRQANQLRGQNV
jgi:hypothetical protein